MASTAVSVEIQKLTPAKAKKLLETNEVNRNLRRKLVDAYRRDMEGGRWAFTAEPIQISRTGRLLNGQHRLTALATSNGVRDLEFVVATGLPDEAQEMMDQGTGRNVGDALTIRHGHIKNVTLVGSISRWMAICPEVGPDLNSNLLRGLKTTTAESVAAFDQYQDLIIRAAEMAGSTFRRHIPGSPTAIGYMWLQMQLVNSQACSEYWAGMMDMEWSYRNDPRKAALRRLQAMHNDPDVKTTLDTAAQVVSILTRTWNAWRKGEEMESIMARGRSGVVPPQKLIP